MTIYECVNGWLAQYDELAHYISEECDGKLSFEEAIETLSRRYNVLDFDAKKKRALIQFLGNGHKFIVTFCGNKEKNMSLLDTVECWFAQRHSQKCLVSKLRSSGYVSKYEYEYYRTFDERSYIIRTYELTERDSKKCSTYYGYSKKDALMIARAEQKLLAKASKVCFYITIQKLVGGTRFYDQVVEPDFLYVLSSKSKKETKFEMRRKLVFDLEVDEYFYDKHDYYDEEDGKDKVVMMSIVKLDKDGNLENDMICCESKDEARKTAHKLIEDWMQKNQLTFDEDSRYFNLCEKRDFGNSITVNCVQNRAEFNVLMKDFEI